MSSSSLQKPIHQWVSGRARQRPNPSVKGTGLRPAPYVER